MPSTPLYSTALIEAASESPNVLLEDLRIIYGAEVLANAPSQGDLFLLGRDRHPRYHPAQYSSTVKSKNLLRLYGQATFDCKSRCRDATYLTTIPAIQPPTGTIMHGGKTLAGQRLAKGRSYYLNFLVQGFKLQNLEIYFSLRNLRGTEILGKQVLIKPGGIAIEDIADREDGSQSISGYIVLLPHETQFAGFSPEFEASYILNIGNGSSREYFLESGFLNFFTP